MKFFFDVLYWFGYVTIFVLIIGYPEYQFPDKMGDLNRFFDNEHWPRTTLAFIFVGFTELRRIFDILEEIRENILDKDKFLTQLKQLSERMQNLSESSSDKDRKIIDILEEMRENIRENMLDKDKFLTQLNQLSERIQNLSESSSDTEDSKYFTIESPMCGTFYCTPGPNKDAFVNVGDSIQKGDKVCIIEAMKTFNEIESEISGKIVKVLVDNASPVDYDQPLFLVDPA
jgi:acetyl-CoA carboxylase biotin carboxyl carrier protein